MQTEPVTLDPPRYPGSAMPSGELIRCWLRLEDHLEGAESLLEKRLAGVIGEQKSRSRSERASRRPCAARLAGDAVSPQSARRSHAGREACYAEHLARLAARRAWELRYWWGHVYTIAWDLADGTWTAEPRDDGGTLTCDTWYGLKSEIENYHAAKPVAVAAIAGRATTTSAGQS